MGDKSKIEWTDATWNPVRGCAKVSEGCRNCYAMRQAHRHSHPGGAYEGLTEIINGRPQWNGKIRLVPESLDDPLHWLKPRRVFVDSMSDLFYEKVPDYFIAEVFSKMADCHIYRRGHTFQILTKRPERALAWFSSESAKIWLKEATDLALAYDSSKLTWPLPNVCFGVSAEDQKTFDERVQYLAATPAAIRFVSLEPLLAEIDCGNAFDDPPDGSPYGRIDWVIAGGESGPNARPSHPNWFRSVRDQCQAGGVPFFFKQWGNWLPEGQLNADGALCENAYVFNDDEFPGTIHYWDHDLASVRVRKKEAGRLLDNRTWDEYPK